MPRTKKNRVSEAALPSIPSELIVMQSVFSVALLQEELGRAPGEVGEFEVAARVRTEVHIEIENGTGLCRDQHP